MLQLKVSLKDLRIARGLTQIELSKDLQISPSTIGMYEQGRREPDLSTLIKIARYFHVTTDYLLSLDDSPHKLVSPLTSQDKELLRKYHTLSPASRGAVDNQLDYFYAQDRPKAEDTAT